jgi:predicted amidophosphoribosyltransferase
LERSPDGGLIDCWAHPHWLELDDLLVITYGTHMSPFRIGSMIKYAKEKAERYHAYGVSAVLYNYLEANWERITAAWQPTLVTYVPSHADKIVQRGFDFLADVVNWYPNDRDHFGIQPALRQISAAEQPGRARVPSAAAWASAPGVQLDGERVVVIDDMVTSGATLAGIAGMLRQNGAAAVYGIGIARAVNADDEKKILAEFSGQEFDWTTCPLAGPA